MKRLFIWASSWENLSEVCNILLYSCLTESLSPLSMWGSRGGTWVQTSPPLLKNRKGFFAIMVWISWKITKLPSQPSMSGHHWPTSVSLVGWWWPPFSVIWIHSQLKKKRKKNNNNKNTFSVGPPLTKLSGSSHAASSLETKQNI